MTFGVLTLATPNDYRKAIGLALSLRVSNPGVPLAIAHDPRLRRELVAPYFDHVIEQDSRIKGFVHKLHLDHYSPFEDTFFFDSDVLVFRDLQATVASWNDQVYNACGSQVRDGVSAFGLDFGKVRAMLGKETLVDISGAGHAYFRKPGCVPVFDMAREVAKDYRAYAGDIRIADEDVMNIVLTRLGLAPRDGWGFFSCHWSAVPGTLKMDASAGRCEMIERGTGKPLEPVMMHFAANQAPFPYARQLRRLFGRFGANPSGIYRIAMGDFWDLEIKPRGKRLVHALIGAGKPQTKSA